MSIKIKVHVLCKRMGTELGDPAVFPTFELAYASMETEFNNALQQYDEGSYNEDESTIGGGNAVIVTNGDWEEWTITECELEVSELHGLASVFEQYLSENYIKYKQFTAEVPQLMATARKLQDSVTNGMLSLRTLLADAVSEATAGKDGGDGV